MTIPLDLRLLLSAIVCASSFGCSSGGTNAPPDLAARDLAMTGTGNKRVFVTAATFAGDLASAGNASSGRAGADHLCNAAAAAAGLGGTWVAWLSDTTNAIDHVSDVGPWHLTDPSGTIAFHNKLALAADPSTAVDYNENGTTNNSDGVWTGSAAGGTASGQSCQAWMNGAAGSVGTFGKSDYTTGGAWTSFQTVTCDSSLHLYCFEQ